MFSLVRVTVTLYNIISCVLAEVLFTAIYQSFDNPKNNMISKTYHKDGSILGYCLFYLF